MEQVVGYSNNAADVVMVSCFSSKLKVHHQIDQYILNKERARKYMIFRENLAREASKVIIIIYNLKWHEKDSGKQPARLLPLKRKSNDTDMMPRRFYVSSSINQLLRSD